MDGHPTPPTPPVTIDGFRLAITVRSSIEVLGAGYGTNEAQSFLYRLFSAAGMFGGHLCSSTRSYQVRSED